MKKIIKKAIREDAAILASLIKNSNKEVALQFGITNDNNPKHPSFYTKEWVLNDLNRGEEYFLFQQNGKSIACVAYESTRADTAYLNRLSVLSTHQNKGIGEELVAHIFKYSKEKKHQQVSIGIIAEHIKLKNWYLKLGFREKVTKSFEHLPFDVTYMSYKL